MTGLTGSAARVWGVSSLTSALFVVVLVLGAMAASRLPRAAGARRVPVATLVALVVVGVPTLLQLTVAPGLLDAWGRDWPRELGGQWWRLVTSLLVQDGGASGAVLNLVGLAVVGALAERAWGARRWAVIAVVAGVGAQLWGAVVQPVGAGNSVVVFGLAAASALAALVRGPVPAPVPARVVGALALLAGLGLLVTGDLHGGAVALGALTGAVLLGRDRRARW